MIRSKNPIFPKMKFNNTFPLFLVLILIGTCREQPEQKPPTTPKEQVASPIIRMSNEQIALANIKTGAVQLRALSTAIECSGSVNVPPRSVHSVHAPVHGFVQSVRHLPGQYVRKGAFLTALSHPELIQKQRDFLEEVHQLTFLESELKRKERLLASDAGAARSYEQVRATYLSSRVRVEGLREELQLIGVPVIKLEESGQTTSQIRLYAPTSGYITEINVHPGKLVDPDDLMYRIVDNRHLHLELEVFARDFPRIKVGQRIEAKLPGSADTIIGQVQLVGKTMDLETRTIRIHGHLSENHPALTVGMYLPCRILVEGDTLPTIEQSAIITENGSEFLFASAENGYSRVPVSTGRSDGTFVELIDWDLPPETEVVCSGAYYIQEGEAEE